MKRKEEVMSAFFKWLQEAKKENKPDMLGFILRYKEPELTGGFRSIDSKIFKNYYQAVAERMKIFKKIGQAPPVYAYFADKTLRPVSSHYKIGSYWHLNRANKMVNDDSVRITGRGKTNHAYLAKYDPNFQIYQAIAYLRREMKPDNMPAQSGEHAPEGFWDHVNAAIDMCTKKVTLSYAGGLYDFIQENYPPNDPNVTTCRMIIRNVLNHYGYAIPPDPEMD